MATAVMAVTALTAVTAGNNWRFDVVFEDENLSDATDFTISADAEVVEETDDATNETG